MICPFSRTIRTRIRAPDWTPERPYYETVERFLPCGNCGVCRTNMVNSWIPRFYGECATSQFQLFITLTYDDEHLKFSNQGVASVDKRHVQLFFKSLRQSLGEGTVRYYLCGEYGGHYRRPHYHVLLFGSDCDAGICEGYVREHWSYGNVHCGTVSAASIRYCANFHVHKCATPDGAEPSFTLMSRRPGIGGLYFDKKLYNVSVNRNYHVFNGRPYSFGRYFKERYTRLTGEAFPKPIHYDPVDTPYERFIRRYPTVDSQMGAQAAAKHRFEYLQKKHNKL